MEGETKSIADPVRDGYTFTGWSRSGSGSSMNNGTFTMGFREATLTANWEKSRFTLTIIPNGGKW